MGAGGAAGEEELEAEETAPGGRGYEIPSPRLGLAQPSPERARSCPGPARSLERSIQCPASLSASEAGKSRFVAREARGVICCPRRPERPGLLAGLPALSGAGRLRSTPGPPSWACAGRAGAPGRGAAPVRSELSASEPLSG